MNWQKPVRLTYSAPCREKLPVHKLPLPVVVWEVLHALFFAVRPRCLETIKRFSLWTGYRSIMGPQLMYRLPVIFMTTLLTAVTGPTTSILKTSSQSLFWKEPRLLHSMVHAQRMALLSLPLRKACHKVQGRLKLHWIRPTCGLRYMYFPGCRTGSVRGNLEITRGIWMTRKVGVIILTVRFAHMARLSTINNSISLMLVNRITWRTFMISERLSKIQFLYKAVATRHPTTCLLRTWHKPALFRPPTITGIISRWMEVQSLPIRSQHKPQSIMWRLMLTFLRWVRRTMPLRKYWTCHVTTATLTWRI